MAGIVNKVYCSSSGLLILGVQIVHINKGEGLLLLHNSIISFLLDFSPSFYLFLNQSHFFIL